MIRAAPLLLLASTAAAAGPRADRAASLTFESGPKQVRLLELYTSEGCSSCPSADAWLSDLAKNPRVFKDFVPAGFHVNYWDYLGWKDRLASPDYAERQRRHAGSGGSGSVYTPGFVLDGKEWRWTDAPPAAGHKAAGSLTGELTPGKTGAQVKVSFAPAEGSACGGGCSATVALLGLGLSSEVKRGENAGRLLKHDFAVLGDVSAPLERTAAGWSAAVNLPKPRVPAPRYALALWVAPAGSLAALQSAGGLLPPDFRP